MRRLLLLSLLLVLTAALVSAQRTNLDSVKICIDPGHGGYANWVVPDPGINFYESVSNWQKALWLKSLLEEQGATVFLTRPTNDADPTLAARVAFANSNNVDWFHSIHSNAWNGAANYTLMLVREQIVTGGDPIYGPGTGAPEWPQAWDMSRLYIGPGIQAKLRTTSNSSVLDWTFYGGSSGGYTLGVLRGLLMPGELSEGSFHDNYPETRRLMNNDYRKMEAYALRNSFMQYYGVPADTLCVIAGIQKDVGTGKPINLTSVRLKPLDRVYSGDAYNNGFYVFDKLPAGTYTVRFETPSYSVDSVTISVGSGATSFVDRSLVAFAAPAVLQSSPVDGDSAFAANLPIVLSFSKPMDTAAVNHAFSIEPPVAGKISWSTNSAIMTFDPDSILPFYVTYAVIVDTTAKSADGQTLDGNGDGTPGDPFVLHFKTKFVDVTPPQIASAEPAPAETLTVPNHVLNFTFNEQLNAATVTTTNFAIQEVGGATLARSVFYSEGPLNGGVTMSTALPLKPGKSYRVRVSGVADKVGNAIPSANPLLWQFTIAPFAYVFTAIDSLKGTPSHWIQPLSNPGTAGATSATFAYSTKYRFPIAATTGGTTRLAFAWNTSAADWLIHTSVDTAEANALRWRRENRVLQVYVHGDGGGTQFRFVVEDSVNAFPQGTPVNHEVSRWITVDWVGWRLVNWDMEQDTVGQWVGDGVLDGELRFNGFQLRYRPGASTPSGELFFAALQLAERTVSSVDNPQAVSIPASYELSRNYPNPFNPSTNIDVSLPGAAKVTVVVYDLLGREVATLANGVYPAGTHRLVWNAGDDAGHPAASGVYFVRLTATDISGKASFVRTRKLILAR